MTYRLPSERVTVTVENGPSIEVERLGAGPLAWTALALASAFYAAKDGADSIVALRNVGAYFLVEAQPAWDIADHRGPIPVTLDGFLRLGVLLDLALFQGWIETHHEKASAADELLPPGEAREEVKRRLRTVKAA